MLDGKKYGSLHETGEEIASCELFLTPKVGHLHSAGLHACMPFVPTITVMYAVSGLLHAQA